MALVVINKYNMLDSRCLRHFGKIVFHTFFAGFALLRMVLFNMQSEICACHIETGHLGSVNFSLFDHHRSGHHHHVHD